MCVYCSFEEQHLYKIPATIDRQNNVPKERSPLRLKNKANENLNRQECRTVSAIRLPKLTSVAAKFKTKKHFKRLRRDIRTNGISCEKNSQSNSFCWGNSSPILNAQHDVDVQSNSIHENKNFGEFFPLDSSIMNLNKTRANNMSIVSCNTTPTSLVWDDAHLENTLCGNFPTTEISNSEIPERNSATSLSTYSIESDVNISANKTIKFSESSSSNDSCQFNYESADNLTSDTLKPVETAPSAVDDLEFSILYERSNKNFRPYLKIAYIQSSYSIFSDVTKSVNSTNIETFLSDVEPCDFSKQTNRTYNNINCKEFSPSNDTFQSTVESESAGIDDTDKTDGSTSNHAATSIWPPIESLHAYLQTECEFSIDEYLPDCSLSDECDDPPCDCCLCAFSAQSKSSHVHYCIQRPIQLRKCERNAPYSQNYRKTVLCNACRLSLNNRVAKNRKGQFKCDYNDCKQVFRTKNSAVNHIMDHMNLKNYSCEVCSHQFKQNSALRTHERKHL